MNSLKKGDRFRVNDRDRGTITGTVQSDSDESSPTWPMVPVLFDGPNERPEMANVRQLEIFPATAQRNVNP